MLVLKCRPGEQIVIGDEGNILVTALTGGRIGVDAPPDTPVDRWTVWQDIQRHGRIRKLA